MEPDATSPDAASPQTQSSPSTGRADELSVGDRVALHELAARYGNVIDDRDWPRLAEVFVPDAVYELHGFGRIDRRCESLTEIVALMRANVHPVAHHVTNVEVTATPNDVRMMSKIVGTLDAGKAGSADYHDVVVKTPSGWRIAERHVHLRKLKP